jgi:hypothetical protein
VTPLRALVVFLFIAGCRAPLPAGKTTSQAAAPEPIIVREALTPDGVPLVMTCTPTGTELCFDATDNNCNGVIDEGCGVDTGPFASLVDNHGVVLVLLGFGLAVAFGTWHAMLPGHGKTLMAAYMVGSETKVRQAVAVGLAVAVMHTASVLGLGLLVITLEQTFRPEALYPWLGLLSGVVAIGLGAYLMIGRLAAWSTARRTHAHAREHAPGHDHDHEGHKHD